LQKQNSDFYTSHGLHVYIKDPFIDDSIDIEQVIAKVEKLVPTSFLSEIEMILVGDFEEFRDRQISAAYKDGALYISNVQADEADIIDDIIHELAHSLEEPHGYELYYDEKIKNEFLQKRDQLHQILWAQDFKTPKAFFQDIEYDPKLDDFLLNKVGYDQLTQLCIGLFINAYAPTSLREYFATGFTDFFMEPDGHNYLQRISPALYKKINALYSNERLDNP
jgi:Mlc titration factor MtfA (ptsG expression regulator)